MRAGKSGQSGSSGERGLCAVRKWIDLPWPRYAQPMFGVGNLDPEPHRGGQVHSHCVAEVGADAFGEPADCVEGPRPRLPVEQQVVVHAARDDVDVEVEVEHPPGAGSRRDYAAS